MWDKADIRIPFSDSVVTELASSTPADRAGFIRIEKYEFPAHCQVAFADGEKVYSDPKAQKWGSISSGISSVAIGFFPEGNGFYRWPHVSIKASPAKILQGHNVFGSEDIRAGIKQMIATLSVAFPAIYQDLDLAEAEIRYLDATYSAHIPSAYQRKQVLKVFESLFPRKTDISRYEGYFQGNKSSERFRQKIYYKGQELEADIEKAKRSRDLDRLEILTDPALLEFAYGRTRFEATIGFRAMEYLGIPTKLSEFLKYQDWFERTHKYPCCRYIWNLAFEKYFAQIEGHTMKKCDDETIKLKIEKNFFRVKENGKVCKRLANSIWSTFRDIKAEGYDQLAAENSSKFFRNVKHLQDIGISKAFLKSLDPKKPFENVIPLVQVINVDFSRQRPDWYTEPRAGFDNPSRHLKLVS